MTTKKLTTVSMLTAVYVVLSILTPVKVLNFKFTFEAFPILITALLMGPLEGMFVGGAGSLIYQLFFSGYGVTVTTPLWILPHLLSGLIVGLFAKKNSFSYSTTKIIIISVISAITVTAFNTLALYVDSKVFGYYTKALVFATIPVKLLVGAILALIYSLILNKLLNVLKSTVK